MATSTITYAGDATLSQNHPRVVSLVSNAEDIYQGDNGGLRMFAAIVSEKGAEDIQLVGSANDFIALYGEPNLRKYGQQNYNIINWLQAGGECAVLRVLPDDAGYAHAFVNIQTKINKDSKKIGNETVNINDVTLRTVLSYSSNNSNDTVLDYELSKERNETADGFIQNFIMMIRPTGRGKYYNRLGVRFTPNKQFDSTSKSRMYDVEVVYYDEDLQVIAVKEGPYRVSFDQDAISATSQESLYIENVINTYSKYIRVKVNHDAIIRAAKIINPNVYPYSIDLLFGEDRYVNGELETFEYSTELSLPVQVALHSYNASGKNEIDYEGNIKKNIITADSLLEGYAIDMDNSYNASLRSAYLHSVNSMKQAAVAVKKGNYETVATEKLNKLTNVYKTSSDPAYVYDTESKTTSALLDIRDTHNFLRAVETDDTDLVIETKIENVEKGISSYKGVKSRVLVIKSTCASLKTSFNTALATNINSIILSNAGIALDELTEIVSSLKDTSTNALSSLEGFITEGGLLKTEREQIEKSLATCKTTYETAIDEYEEEESIKTAVNSIKGVSSSSIILSLIDTISAFASKLEEEVRKTLYGNALGTVMDGIIDSIVAIKNTKLLAAAEESALDTIKATIANAQSYQGGLVPLIHSTLQSMNEPARLTGGNEGSIADDAAERDVVIKGLLISAYSGALDEKVINKKVLPFNFILDAGYDIDIKNIINSLASDVRRDFVFLSDCGYGKPTVQDVLNYRTQYNVSSNYTAIYSQEVTLFDQYTTKDQKFTMPYVLASKFPTLHSTTGLHLPIAGNKRGLLDGFKAISFTPNDLEQEELYNARVNYAVADTKKTKLMSQLTSNYTRTPLSDLNNVITMLSVKREAEEIMENYQFEFADNDTMRAMETQLTNDLNKYIVSNALDAIGIQVYASDYDLSQHIVRANVTLKFKAIIETVIITLEVTK